MRPLILASGSSARFRVLTDAGFAPEVVVSGVDEGTDGLSSTAEMVVLLAERKADAVAALLTAGRAAIVLGCDSMLDLDGVALGKPETAEVARDMWRRLAGRRAVLHSGHCLVDTASGRRARGLATAAIQFGTPRDDELEAYLATGEALQMAGAFSIEARSGPFVESIEGHPSTVLGLSLPLLRSLLHEIGVSMVELWESSSWH